MARSISNWTINPDTFGISLDQLVATELPTWDVLMARTGLALPQPSGYIPRRVDDFSPTFNPDGAGLLKIVPFSRLDDIIQNGDIVVFMEQAASFEIVPLIKQRGWHAELAFRDAEGRAVQCAPWGEPTVQDHRCTDLANHRHYDSKRWNLHIFRISSNVGQDGQLAALLAGIRGWRTIFNSYQFPPGERWYFDPVDFGTITELEDIACCLVRAERVPDMFCMQWVHAILSLALNIPLTRGTLDRLGLYEAYQRNWPHVGLLNDSVTPIGRLPIVPYSQADLIVALCSLYLGLSPSALETTLPALFQMDAVKAVLQGTPARTVLPIVPFSEYRKAADTGALPWEYVATTFADSQCKLQ